MSRIRGRAGVPRRRVLPDPRSPAAGPAAGPGRRAGLQPPRPAAPVSSSQLPLHGPHAPRIEPTHRLQPAQDLTTQEHGREPDITHSRWCVACGLLVRLNPPLRRAVPPMASSTRSRAWTSGAQVAQCGRHSVGHRLRLPHHAEPISRCCWSILQCAIDQDVTGEGTEVDCGGPGGAELAAGQVTSGESALRPCPDRCAGQGIGADLLRAGYEERPLPSTAPWAASHNPARAPPKAAALACSTRRAVAESADNEGTPAPVQAMAMRVRRRPVNQTEEPPMTPGTVSARTR